MVPLKERLSRPGAQRTTGELLTAVRDAQQQPIVETRRRRRRRVHKLDDKQRRDLVRAYQAGGTVSGLAREFKIDRTTVRSVLDRAQVSRRRQGRVLSPSEIDRAAQLYAGGMSLRTVGAELAVDYRVVRRELVAGGLRLRRAGRQR